MAAAAWQVQLCSQVPPWLRGLWSRDFIRRATEGGELGPEDTGIDVHYVQTPWAFVDVRRPRDPSQGLEGALAFGGVVSVLPPSPGSPAKGLVRWHACMNWDEPVKDTLAAWAAADADKPLDTEDQGWFTRSGSNDEGCEVYMEEDDPRTLQERWVHRSSGDNRFLAMRRLQAGSPAGLLVVAGTSWALAEDGRGAGCDEAGMRYFGGSLADGSWRITLSVPDKAMEGQYLTMTGRPEEWTVLPGSTLTPPGSEGSILPALGFAA